MNCYALRVQPAKSDKAKLISRMAKMGQPMLPVMHPSPTDSPDTEVWRYPVL